MHGVCDGALFHFMDRMYSFRDANRIDDDGQHDVERVYAMRDDVCVCGVTRDDTDDTGDDDATMREKERTHDWVC